MTKSEVVAALRQAADEIESHPETRAAAAVPPWLKTTLAILAQLLTQLVPLLGPAPPGAGAGVFRLTSVSPASPQV